MLLVSQCHLWWNTLAIWLHVCFLPLKYFLNVHSKNVIHKRIETWVWQNIKHGGLKRLEKKIGRNIWKMSKTSWHSSSLFVYVMWNLVYKLYSTVFISQKQLNLKKKLPSFLIFCHSSNRVNCSFFFFFLFLSYLFSLFPFFSFLFSHELLFQRSSSCSDDWTLLVVSYVNINANI